MRVTRLMTVQSSSNVLLSSTPGLQVVVDAERALKRPRRPEERMLLAGWLVSDPLDSVSAIPRETRDPRLAPRAPGAEARAWVALCRPIGQLALSTPRPRARPRCTALYAACADVPQQHSSGTAIAHRYACVMR